MHILVREPATTPLLEVPLMIYFLALALVAAYFLGPFTFQVAGVVALIALFCGVAMIGLGMRGMERHEI